MKAAALFSGGKDSTYAVHLAIKEGYEIEGLLCLVSDNPDSYMFHTPNIDITLLQSQAMRLPLVRVSTKGEKEKELEDLKKAIQEAKDRYGIDGIVSGAVRSTYQASRIQKICHELGLWCFNPLWLKDQVELLKEVRAKKIKTIISGVFAEPFDESYLGAEIDEKMIEQLSKQHNPAGEGGEIETTALDAPVFKKKINVTKSSTEFEKFSGVYTIEDAELQEK